MCLVQRQFGRLGDMPLYDITSMCDLCGIRSDITSVCASCDFSIYVQAVTINEENDASHRPSRETCSSGTSVCRASLRRYLCIFTFLYLERYKYNPIANV